MSFTPQQQYQLLLSVIEEAQRLAQKFGLNDGVVMLEEFKKSLQNPTNPHSLVNIIDQEKLFQKTYKEKRLHLSQLIATIFGYDLSSKKPDQDLKKILSPSDKEVKKITTENDDIFDFNKVIGFVKDNVRDYIKLKFGVTKTDISEARVILEKRLLGSPEEITKVTDLVRIFHQPLEDEKPLNYKFHTININGLYKLIKILNGIQNDSLAKACVSFFTKDTTDNQLIIKAFFAAEKTEQYCRNSSLLVQTLAELVNQDSECNEIGGSLVKGLFTQSKETSIEILISDKTNPANEVFIQFLIAVLNTAIHFKPILDMAMQDLSNRDPKISQLQASKDVFLKSAFYFGLISPILANVESKLGQEWPPQACQKFRLELSIAFDIMLGLKSADKIAQIKSRGVICSSLFDLVTSPLMQETVKRTFAAIGKSEGENQTSSSTFDYLADSEDKSQKIVISPRNLTPRKSSSTQVDHEESPSSSNRTTYARTRGISFYNSTSIANRSETKPSQPEPKSESNRKRALSAIPKKVSLASHAVPKLSLPTSGTLPKEDSLESYFNDLFTSDREKTIQFVLALVRNKDKKKFSWAIRVLNEACDKTNKQIAEVLINNLTQSELLDVFDELFRQEKSDSWCRGNKLLPALIQHYMAQMECREFKDFIWDTLFSLAKPISGIKVQQRSSMAMTPDSFTAETTHITLLQQEFFTVMKSMLSPKNFPPLIQKVLCLAYADLALREEIHNIDNNRMRTFLGFILLRFINPIIQQEATSHVMDQNLKMWYLKILPTAVQSFSSLLSHRNSNPEEEATLQEAIFNPVTKDTNFREQLFSIITTELALDAAEEKQGEPSSLEALDIPACIRELSDMLKMEEFSGLSFKSNGSVMTPRRDSPKPHIVNFFQLPSDSDDRNLSQAPTSASGTSKNM